MKLSRRQVFELFGSAAIASAVPKLPALEPIVAALEDAPTGNTILSVDMIVREALAVLHRTNGFVVAINKQYDATFARLGTLPREHTLRVRMPAQYKLKGATVETR